MRKDVDWTAVKAAEKAMIEAGIKPILLLTHDDAEAAVGHELSETVVDEALHLMRTKWENGWSDVLSGFVGHAELIHE